MGGGSVDDPGSRVLRQRHRLHGGGVRQAEENQIGLVHQPLPLGSVLPLVLVDEKELNILPSRQPVINLQAGGALLAVDIYNRLTHGEPPQ